MTAPAYYSTFATALGAFSIAVNEAGAVVATAFGGVEALLDRHHREHLSPDEDRTREAREQIADYLHGRRTAFDLPLAAEGSPFQRRVWAALCQIPRGETRSYGALGRELQSSARAVGRANATNPICLIVPCHRVIGANGALTGFAFGEQIKARLLSLEGVDLFRP
jgi:methylated-DNA-[protein]-cysteine S-methyltransferase